MALVQFNLKVGPAIAEHWRREAAAGGFASVREYLVAATVPKAASPLPPQLEARISALEIAMAALSPSPQAAPIPAAPARPLVAPAAVVAPAPVLTGEGPAPITTAELAELLGITRRSFNERLRRGGGAQVGLVVEGWRCVGQFPPPAGGPLRWLWEPA
jgi:hypothetical protein